MDKNLTIQNSVNGDTNLFEVDKNHIYFYCDVTKKTCLMLNKKINELNKTLLIQSIDLDSEPIPIYLHINSFGGSLFAAFSSIDTILNSKVPIISIIEGGAASAATIISMVCHKRLMTQNSYMLIHQLSSGMCGKFEELKDDFINDAKLMKLLYKLYYEHTNMGINKIKKILKRDLWLEYDECLKLGLVDACYDDNVKSVRKDSTKIKHKLTIDMSDENPTKKRKM
jgi:ATP-dependent protease ClpP protease subunit